MLAEAARILQHGPMPARLPRNFGAYAAMEAFNILLVPGTVLYFAFPIHPLERVATLLAAVACAGLLLVGARYWAGVHARVTRRELSGLERALDFAERTRRPLLWLTVAAAAAVLWTWAARGLTAPVIGAGVLTILAALEYVNYFHRQLQHFDRWTDLKRLLATRRLPRAHMARALAARRGVSRSAAEPPRRPAP